MSYVKTEWATGDVITAQKLNNMENGIEAVDEYAEIFTADVSESVENWLDDHPEATTTVEDNAITTPKLQDGAVTTPKLANGSVTDDKLASDGIKAEVSDLKTDLDKYADIFTADVSESVSNWLDEHPEATTSVEDYSLTNKKLVKGTLGYVTPNMFDAIENGVCNIEKFQSMVDYAIENHLNIKLDSDFDFNFVANSTIDSPTRILIKNCDSMVFDGDGYTVTMKGLTKDYLFSIDDEASSGRDIFTFLSFVLCNNVLVRGLKVKGEYTFDSSYDFRYQSPRAKAVGFMGTYYAKVTDCTFIGIFGNGVNFTPSSNARDGEWRGCNHCVVDNCYAQDTLENGFNNMGGTVNIMYNKISCYRCKGGIETGTNNTTITQSYFSHCKNSFALGGNDTVSNVYVEDGGVYLNSTKEVFISNSILILSNHLYLLYNSKVHITNTLVKLSESEWSGQYNYLLYAVGSSANANMEIFLDGCKFDMGTKGMMINWAKILSIHACELLVTSGNVAIIYNTTNFLMTGTIYNGGIAGTFTNDNVRIN